MFLQQLEYKAVEAGAQVVQVSPRNTSQGCAGCGQHVPKSLSVRVHRCSLCGLVLDRDVNGAQNVLLRALHIPPGRGGQTLTYPVADCVV